MNENYMMMRMKPTSRERRKHIQLIAEGDPQFPHRQPVNAELRRIIERARETRATPAQAAAALEELGRLLQNKYRFYYWPRIRRTSLRLFKHDGKTFAVKLANYGAGYNAGRDHGAGTYKYANFAECYRKAVKAGTIYPKLVLVKMKAYGKVDAHGNTFLIMERIAGKPIRTLDRIKLAKYVRRAKPDYTPQIFHAIKLGRLKDGRPVIMLPHDYA